MPHQYIDINGYADVTIPLRKKCPYSEFFWSMFSRIRTECGEILHISPYSVQMRENTNQKNPEYGHFLSSVSETNIFVFCESCDVNQWYMHIKLS